MSTQEERDEAGPCPESCIVKGEQRVEAPWLRLKDGWWHCDACGKFAHTNHQNHEKHKEEAVTWLVESRNWSRGLAEAIVQSVEIHPNYMHAPPADGPAAAAAADGDPGAPPQKKPTLKSRQASRDARAAGSSSGDKWPSWATVQAQQGAAALPSERFIEHIVEIFEAKKMLAKLGDNSSAIGDMAEKVKTLAEKLDGVKDKLQTDADDVKTGMDAVKDVRREVEELKSEVQKVQENVKAEMDDVKAAMRTATAAMMHQTQVWEQLVNAPPEHILTAGAAAAPATPPGLPAETPAGAPAAAAASEDARPK